MIDGEIVEDSPSRKRVMTVKGGINIGNPSIVIKAKKTISLEEMENEASRTSGSTLRD